MLYEGERDEDLEARLEADEDKEYYEMLAREQWVDRFNEVSEEAQELLIALQKAKVGSEGH